MTKKPKNDPNVQYRVVSHTSQMCGHCAMYLRPSRCTAVQGVIHVGGWCKLFDSSPQGARK